ncbi:unnamed protein product [Clonostachys rosea]|uniref:Zn(2)-C6 fungal-type domain-containing protein n=1 Tax=Bionectria ochroleuca TaxID=29856 RepID=A0ABY6TYC0_BIOOC|nr:unnamed protein product [Clonostachys rosea]
MSVSKSRQLRTACDRCYELKARCARVHAATSCSRCDRLGLVCSNIRPYRPAGRRITRQSRSTSTGLSAKSGSDIDSNARDISTLLNNHADLLPDQRELLLFLLDAPESLDCYVVCPSFQVAEQQSLMEQLPGGLPVLKDAYLACAVALKNIQLSSKPENGCLRSIQHTSSAMNTLRSLPVSNSQDAALCLTLGVMLALSIYSTVGLGVADVCHYCLSTTSPFVASEVPDPALETRQGFLALLELMDCLVYRRRPTLRIQPSNSRGVDRHLGLCSPLLPYYYDLCVVSHSLANAADKGSLATMYNKLDEIQLSLEEWQPSCLDDQFINRFSTADAVNLLAQAKVYRLAALLVAHRLRYAFGEQDAQADIWASEIMMELNMAQRITKRLICFVTLPFLVAAVELRDPSARGKALYQVEEFVDNVTPVLKKAGRTFLMRIWQERDSRTTAFWLDSVHKPCPVLQSLDPACLV